MKSFRYTGRFLAIDKGTDQTTMPTHSLRSCVEGTGRLSQEISMIPHNPYSENATFPPGGSGPLSCVFCAQTFIHEDELDLHILSQHPTTVIEPGVLRVDLEFKMPGERLWAKPSVLPVQKEEVRSCVCGYISQDASQLETHMKKHKEFFFHCCNVCGRRFKHLWLLKNHLKKHLTKGPKSKAQQDPDTPVTINGTVQDLNPEPVVTLYKMCMACGFFFPDQESLVEHSKVHTRELEPGKAKATENLDGSPEPPVNQNTFLHGLKILPRSTGKSWQKERSSKWIPQLDPFVTFQAWQLATKGKLAVGCSHTKNTDQEASTDNDSHSEKDERNNISSKGKGEKVEKEVPGRKLRSQRQTVVETPEAQQPSPTPKDKEKKRPIACEERQGTFHNSQQLDLNSTGLQKHEGSSEESPPAVDRTVSGAGEHLEEGCEEGLEEAAPTENLGSDEDDRSKVKSKVCTYCGKSFRSSYNLTVHLRTHTGEKPFKCAYCNYAAARKTSLKNHLERRHMDKPILAIPSGPGPSVPSPKSCTEGTPEEKPDIIKCPVPPSSVDQKMEEVKEENSEVLLNLSLKVSPSVPASPEPTALIQFSCSYCPYKSLYPEVLTIHKRLNHKDKSDNPTETGFGAGLKRGRRTGCPPALNGVDVAPLVWTDRYYLRSTRSPPGPLAKPQEPSLINPPRDLNWSPTNEALDDEPMSKRLKVTVNGDSH